MDKTDVEELRKSLAGSRAAMDGQLAMIKAQASPAQYEEAKGILLKSCARLDAAADSLEAVVKLGGLLNHPRTSKAVLAEARTQMDDAAIRIYRRSAG
jgi:hypothetical protein